MALTRHKQISFFTKSFCAPLPLFAGAGGRGGRLNLLPNSKFSKTGGDGGLLTKDLVTFKRQDGVKDEKLSILWVH